MIRCFNCATENFDGTRYCSNCGALLQFERTIYPEDDDPAEAAPLVPPVPMSVPYPAPVPAQAPAPAPASAPRPVQQSQNTSYVQPEGTNGLCLAGLILSIVSLFCCGLPSIISLAISIAGYIMTNKNRGSGKGLAVAGIVISCAGLLFLLILSISGRLGNIGDN